MKSKKETETQVSMNEMGEKREEYRRKGGKCVEGRKKGVGNIEGE